MHNIAANEYVVCFLSSYSFPVLGLIYIFFLWITNCPFKITTKNTAEIALTIYLFIYFFIYFRCHLYLHNIS